MKNREYKFRVWDVQKKLFVNHINDYLKLGSNKLITIPEHSEEYIIQQYTGLKDKNGKDIYEGDILNCKGYDDWFDTTGFYFNFEVKFSIEKAGESDLTGYLYIPEDRELIGNVLENPELLKIYEK